MVHLCIGYLHSFSFTAKCMLLQSVKTLGSDSHRALQSLRCSHQCCWRFECFRMWQCVTGWAVPELKLQLRGQAIFLDCLILNMKALLSFAVSVTTYPVTQWNIFIHSADLDGNSARSSWHFGRPHGNLNELTKFFIYCSERCCSSTQTKLTGPVNGDECHFWRTTGCAFGNKCRYKHLKENKGIDKKPWQRAV
jgi:hypothetical protein